MQNIENHYKTERKAEFYARMQSVSSKHLNQVTRERVGKTITQLLHERLILEAKRELSLAANQLRRSLSC